MTLATTPGPELRATGLAHAFGPREVLEHIDLVLPAGRTLALVGPSGSGKSTLLHLCAGLLTLREGRIENGFARTAMLFQQPQLLPWKTALDNIALGLKARRVGRAERLAAARAMGHAMGLDDLALAQFPPQLSGGMQGRAALARALVLQPDLLLLDEPFSALDIGLRQQMHRLLLAEQARRGLAVLMITHDLMEAVQLADQVLLLAGSPARMRWQLDLTLPATRRDDAWVHRQTALMLAQPAVREAFELPELPAGAPAHALPPGDLSAGQAIAAAERAPSHGCEVPL